MSWAFKHLVTDDTGDITSNTDITDIVKDFPVEETAGDEYRIQSGEITISHQTPLTYAVSSTDRYWLALYIQGDLYNIYQIQSTYDSYNEKTEIYETRLLPIQLTFYSDLKLARVFYSSNVDHWNYGIPSAIKHVEEIKFFNGLGGIVSTTDVAAISLSEVISTITNKHNGLSYKVADVFQSLPTGTAQDHPLIYRGGSVAIGDTNQNIIDGTFGTDVYWDQLFKLVANALNAWIRVTPFVVSGTPDTIQISVEFIPRELSPTITSAAVWIERTIVKGKFAIDGIKFNGANFTHTIGNENGKNVRNVDLDISDPNANQNTDVFSLHWSAGNWNAGISKYQILNAGIPRPYFAEGLVDGNYSNTITNGDGIEGKIKLGDEKILSQIQYGSTVVLVNKLSFGRERIADIEGVLI